MPGAVIAAPGQRRIVTDPSWRVTHRVVDFNDHLIITMADRLGTGTVEYWLSEAEAAYLIGAIQVAIAGKFAPPDGGDPFAELCQQPEAD